MKLRLTNRRIPRQERHHLHAQMSQFGVTSLHGLVGFCLDESQDLEARVRALWLLGELRARETIDSLLDLGARATDELLIWHSLTAVGMIRSHKAVLPLIRIARTADLDIRKRAAINGLALLGDKRARSPLVAILTDLSLSPRTRGAAAEALGLVRPDRLVARVLLASLEDPSVEVRLSAICAIEALRLNEALPALERLFRDSTVVLGEGSVADRARKATQIIGLDTQRMSHP